MISIKKKRELAAGPGDSGQVPGDSGSRSPEYPACSPEYPALCKIHRKTAITTSEYNSN
jgi:hypothetical protein